MNKIVRALRSGQITIPASFREKLGIDADSLLQMTLMEGELRIKPVQVSREPQGSPWLREAYEAFSPVREEIKRKGFTHKEINEAIDKAVKAVRKSHAKSSR
ncbi:MAG: transcriptional regulator, AbrB family [Microgenomates group bacterium Gr01-1014_80]|nr:MAG: transcriptional regulator, AbrB family [Microgenomates group bacterium Gr01-1014_80]